MMWNKTAYAYLKNAEVEAVEMPYEDERFSMVVLMPVPGTFEDFVARADGQVLADLTGQMQSGRVELRLPLFEIDSMPDLKTALKSLGMTTAFSMEADFTAIADPLPGGPWLITDVVQKAFVTVNENGTEAAAATGVTAAAGGRCQRRRLPLWRSPSTIPSFTSSETADRRHTLHRPGGGPGSAGRVTRRLARAGCASCRRLPEILPLAADIRCESIPDALRRKMDHDVNRREGGFNALYDAHYSAVRAYAWRRAPAFADDVVAETFLVAWKRLEDVPADAALPWLLGVARNAHLNPVRGERRRRERELATRRRGRGTSPRSRWGIPPRSTPTSRLLDASSRSRPRSAARWWLGKGWTEPVSPRCSVAPEPTSL